MIPKQCKRLAEVDFPIAVVSKHSAREKSIRHGHPSTLHLWWARRPLGSCRAMLLGLLLPDPCDPHCPGEFKAKAAKVLLDVPGWDSQRRQEQVKSDEGLRRALLDFIGEVADWDVAHNPRWIGAARELVKAAHPDETPLVVDPFAGGGSIPLEALRLGCEAFASDLNPVACLILKVMLEDIPSETHRRGAEGVESLVDELRRVGKEIKQKAEQELKDLYPDDPDGSRPIAYLWARTVRCEAPNCGAEIPLIRSFWLCKKPNRKIALRPLRLSGEISFEILEPQSEKEVPPGTVTRAKATCLCCGTVLPPERVRAQLAAQRGGADVIFEDIHRRDAEGAEENLNMNGSSLRPPRLCGESAARTGGARMLAVVTLKPGKQGRHYRLPTDRDYHAVWKAQKRLKEILDEWERGGRQGLCPVPDELLPPIGTLGFCVQRYGMLQWGDLFTARQKVAMVTLRILLDSHNTQDHCRPLVALATTRFLDDFSSLVRWMDRETPAATFTRHALPVLWDFCETYPFDNASWAFKSSVDWVALAVEGLGTVRTGQSGQVQLAGATECLLPDETVPVWFANPPYYNETQRMQRENEVSEALQTAMAAVVGRCASFFSSLNMWVGQGEFIANVFGRQALPIVWDFCEAVPASTESGGFEGALNWTSRVIGLWSSEAQRMQRENEISEALRTALAVSLGKTLRHCNGQSKWHRGSETVAGAFGIQALPMSWDFPETPPSVDYAGGIEDAQQDVVEPAEAAGALIRHSAQVQLADATEHPLPDETAQVWFTDPPYYDAVPYADLSDFFFVWLKRTLPGHPLLRDPFDPANPLTPKTREAVQDKTKHENGRPKDRAWFEETMARAFAEGRRVLREDGAGSVVFAHKTTEGWEALLSGLIRGGWTITGSWPIVTERPSRLRARESAALATSVHLVCRPRPEDAPVGDWGEVLRELPKRVGHWMERLQGEGIRGADLVFACIGPAMEIFSRYRTVETADGREVKLPEFLEKVWEVVGRTALEQVLGTGTHRGDAESAEKESGKKDSASSASLRLNGAAGAVEEDARLTAFFLWTLQSTNGEEARHSDADDTENGEEDIEEGEETMDEKASTSSASRQRKGFSIAFDAVRRFTQPLGIDLSQWEGRIIETSKGMVRLMAVSERTKQLFGKDGVDAAADQIMEDPQKNLQQVLCPEQDAAPRRRRGRSDKSGPTTLDRVHAAMLLQAGGRADALRALIKAEQQRSPDFLRLANALSALYPKKSEEKRLLDAMLLAVPR